MTHTNESSSLVKVAPKVGKNGTRRFSWTLSVNRRLSPKQPADGESTILFGRRRRLHRWHMTNPQQACRVWERTDERAGHGLFFPSFERTRITNGSNLLLLDVIAPRWRAAQRDSAFPTQAPGSDKKPKLLPQRTKRNVVWMKQCSRFLIIPIKIFHLPVRHFTRTWARAKWTEVTSE